MKTRIKSLTALVAALALILSLSACGGDNGTKNAKVYIQGLMDETYLGVFNKDYLDLVDATENEAEEDYLGGLEAEYYNRFVPNFSIDDSYVTEETRDAAIDLLADVYKNAKYTVKDPTKSGENYAVEVEVEPVAVFYDVYEEDMNEEFYDTFNADFPEFDDGTLDAMDQGSAEYEAFWTRYENAWLEAVIGLSRARLDAGNVTYQDADSIIVQFKPDPADGLYTITDTDFQNLDKLILAY